MDQTPQNLPNWIAAFSTAATALGGGFAAIYGLYRASRSRLPTVEATAYWGKDKARGFVGLNLVVRNRIYETLICKSVKVHSPGGMCTAKEIRGKFGDFDGLERENGREQTLGFAINALGTPLSQSGLQPSDTVYRTIYFAPPEGWSGGKLKVSLRFSSKADTIRSKRITITRQVPVANITKTEAIASNQG